MLIPEPVRTLRGRLWHDICEFFYDPSEAREAWEWLVGAIGLVLLGIPFLALLLLVLPIALLFKLLLWPVERTRFAHQVNDSVGRLFDREKWLVYAVVLPFVLAWPAVGIVMIFTHHAPAFANPRQFRGYFTYFAGAPLMILGACATAGYITKEWIGPAVIAVTLGVIAPVVAMLYMNSAL